jgi:hypothetical protein
MTTSRAERLRVRRDYVNEAYPDVVEAIEAEARAARPPAPTTEDIERTVDGLMEQYGGALDALARHDAEPPALYPCINCGTALGECWEGHRCCDDSDHPYRTLRETLDALHRDAAEPPALDAPDPDIAALQYTAGLRAEYERGKAELDWDLIERAAANTNTSSPVARMLAEYARLAREGSE